MRNSKIEAIIKRPKGARRNRSHHYIWLMATGAVTVEAVEATSVDTVLSSTHLLIGDSSLKIVKFKFQLL